MAQNTFRDNPDALLTIFARILLIIAGLAVFVMLIACYVMTTQNQKIVYLASPAWFDPIQVNSKMSQYPWGQVLFM